MDRYQLIKLVDWAGSLESRKRMQKVIFLLQAAGCPFKADYFLHLYGPYSSDVAGLTDVLVTQGFLAETEVGNVAGKQFRYKLQQSADESLRKYEATPDGKAKLNQMKQWEPIAKDLLSRELSELEYASTVAYFKSRGSSWDDSLSEACKFKRLDPSSLAARSALDLAKSVMEPAE